MRKKNKKKYCVTQRILECTFYYDCLRWIPLKFYFRSKKPTACSSVYFLIGLFVLHICECTECVCVISLMHVVCLTLDDAAATFRMCALVSMHAFLYLTISRRTQNEIEQNRKKAAHTKNSETYKYFCFTSSTFEYCSKSVFVCTLRFAHDTFGL